MTAQKRFGNTHRAFGSGSHSGHKGSGHQGHTGPCERMRITALLAAAILASLLPTVGCKTGTSFAKPSWWTLGGTPKPEGDTLASAPPYGGGIAKPSESAKPYPTTTTPGGYVITGSAGPSATVAQQFQAPQSQTPVVYGSTPLPQSTSIAAGPATTAASPMAGSQSMPPSIAPQVGPYATLGGDSIPPPGQPLPPFAPSTSTGMSGMSGMSGLSGAGGMSTSAGTSGMSGAGGTSPMPSEATLPNSAYSSFSLPAANPAGVELPPARMADARASDPAATIPAAALPVEAAGAYGGSRYSTARESRFAGAEPASFPATPSPSPTSYGSPVEAPLPTSPSAFPAIAPPAAAPPTGPRRMSVPESLAPGLLEPGVQPVRRPDPVYRPGGTSSYRPSRAILADDSAPASMAVQSASYEEPAQKPAEVPAAAMQQ